MGSEMCIRDRVIALWSHMDGDVSVMSFSVKQQLLSTGGSSVKGTGSSQDDCSLLASKQVSSLNSRARDNTSFVSGELEMSLKFRARGGSSGEDPESSEEHGMESSKKSVGPSRTGSKTSVRLSRSSSMWGRISEKLSSKPRSKKPATPREWSLMEGRWSTDGEVERGCPSEEGISWAVISIVSF